MSAQSGQEVERRKDAGRGRVAIAAAPALPAVVDEGVAALAASYSRR